MTTSQKDKPDESDILFRGKFDADNPQHQRIAYRRLREMSSLADLAVVETAIHILGWEQVEQAIQAPGKNFSQQERDFVRAAFIFVARHSSGPN